ncbi:hypothetical protein BaRGS_00005968 [Batillaria attramentaria]|uniref:Uncharacterized protein n=1 Tax=Batillaria attramentaria TaxID=370345 RepID=A0ABD0LTK8_9CAEN
MSIFHLTNDKGRLSPPPTPLFARPFLHENFKSTMKKKSSTSAGNVFERTEHTRCSQQACADAGRQMQHFACQGTHFNRQLKSPVKKLSVISKLETKANHSTIN